MTRYSKVYMLFFVVAVAGLLQNNKAIAQSALICNKGAYNATCLFVNFPNDNVGYNRFVIPPNQYRKVNIGTQVRCSIDIHPRGETSTWLNYFVIDQKGVYTIRMHTVPHGQGTRYATVHSFDQAKRIKYTITNSTAFPIQLLFLPNRNTTTLAPGKKTPCNSPVRNGGLPVVQATSPTTGGIYQIPIFWEGCNYRVLQHGQGIVIVPEKN